MAIRFAHGGMRAIQDQVGPPRADTGAAEPLAETCGENTAAENTFANKSDRPALNLRVALRPGPRMAMQL